MGISWDIVGIYLAKIKDLLGISANIYQNIIIFNENSLPHGVPPSRLFRVSVGIM
jgi:hypothetical protein